MREREHKNKRENNWENGGEGSAWEREKSWEREKREWSCDTCDSHINYMVEACTI